MVQRQELSERPKGASFPDATWELPKSLIWRAARALEPQRFSAWRFFCDSPQASGVGCLRRGHSTGTARSCPVINRECQPLQQMTLANKIAERRGESFPAFDVSVI